MIASLRPQDYTAAVADVTDYAVPLPTTLSFVAGRSEHRERLPLLVGRHFPSCSETTVRVDSRCRSGRFMLVFAGRHRKGGNVVRGDVGACVGSTAASGVGTPVVLGRERRHHQTGTLYITVLRQTYTATGSGKLAPHMRDKPWLNVQLQSAPAAYNRETMKYTCGTGTTFDFNVTLKSIEFGVPLPMGEYVFAYEARVLDYQPGQQVTSEAPTT